MTFRSKYNTTIRGRSKRTFEEYTLLAIISGAFKMLLVMGAAYLDKFSKLSLYDEDIYDFSFPSKKKKKYMERTQYLKFPGCKIHHLFTYSL